MALFECKISVGIRALYKRCNDAANTGKYLLHSHRTRTYGCGEKFHWPVLECDVRFEED
jgi:hypothetical protein